jgi:hypothetical protein
MAVSVEEGILYDTSMYPHQIRLRGPWEAEPLHPPGALRRVNLPTRLADCGLGDCRRVRFIRRFGRPRKLESYERVWLIGERLPGLATLELNGTDLGKSDVGEFEFPVTDLLGEQNTLSIELEPSGDLEWGDVALEVRCAAYLSDVRVMRSAQGGLRVVGNVRGETDGPLDIYAVAETGTIGYMQCSAGGPFELHTDALPPSDGILRVELVNGALVWYVVEMDLVL